MKKKRGVQFPLTQFIAIIVITISLFLVVDFARRTAATYRIRNEAARLETEVASVRAQRQVLQARLDYVQSDAYVEEIARTQFKWAKPGESVVVVLAPTPQAPLSSAPSVAAPQADLPAPRTPWQAWWRVFFDTSPIFEVLVQE